MIKKAVAHLDRLTVVVIASFCLLYLVLISVGGQYLHYSGDDFSLKHLSTTGFVNYFEVFLSRLNGRFSYSLVAFFLYQLPEPAARLTPILFEALFVTGFYKFIGQITQKTKSLPLLAIGFILTFSLVTMSANIYQTIYWLPSYLAYGLPLSLLLFFMAHWLGLLTKEPSNTVLGAIFCFALIIGGLHELIAVLGTLLMSTILALISINRFLVDRAKLTRVDVTNKFKLLLAPALGFLTSIIVNYLLPATQARRETSFHSAEQKLEAIRSSSNFSVYLFNTTIAQPIVLFCLFATLLCALIILKKHSVKPGPFNIHPTTVYIALFTAFILPFCFLFMSALLTRFSQGLNPPPREYILFDFCIILSVVLVGFLLAYLSLKLSRRSITATTVSIIIVITAVSPFIFIDYSQKALSLNALLKVQGREAVARDTLVRQQINVGSRDISVQSFTTIGDTPYPKADKNYWFNKEMKQYYNVNSFSADSIK